MGILECVTALQVWAIWLAPFRLVSSDVSWHPLQILLGAFSLLLIILPFSGLWVIHSSKRWGFLLFAAFPLVSVIYGVTALPFVKYFYGKDVILNSLFIAVINALVCALAFWFFVSARPGYGEPVNQSFTVTED